jgi:branched-chain amino acid transport system ATP-binding protein
MGLATPILSVSGVTKRFGGLVAVSNLSFDVQAGEIVGLMGPNGAGKTTILNVISGEYKPDSGTIHFQRRNIVGIPPHKICHLGIARTYQIPQPFTNLTVIQNIMAAARFGANLEKTATEGEAARILEITELAERKDTPARDLLVVTLKRLEIARALAAKPKLVLLDEVAAGLTEAEIPRLLGIFKKIHEMGVTIILIEHVMKVMMEAVDRIVVLDEGVKIAEGTPKEIMENRRVIEAYFG